MNFLRLTDLDVRGKTVLIRTDMNVPMKDGKISEATRIRSSMPSIQYCLDNGAGVILMTHLGRPTEGELKPEDDVTYIADYVGELLGQKVPVLNDWRENKPTVKAGEVVMLQNIRINKGEKKNDMKLGQEYANLCDIFANDAFGAAHRAQASLEAVAQLAPIACAGVLMTSELESLAQALENPARPLVAIVAGSKVSTKLTVLETLADKVDHLIVGGGIANTFLLAQGANIGKSLAEPDLVADSQRIITKMTAKGGSVPLPVDVVTAKEFAETATAESKALNEISNDDMILDIGQQSAANLAEIIKNAGTIVWNGPVGVFEFDQFAGGTQALTQAIAQSKGFSIAGGGDTLAAIAKFNVGDKINYICTGGGAFLEFLEGRSLPAVHVLEERAKNSKN